MLTLETVQVIGTILFLFWAMHLITVSFYAVENLRMAYMQRALALAMVIAAVLMIN